MAAKNKPYEQFGPFILFKKLEADALGELWRAGKIENGQLGPIVALRRFTGGDRAALAAAAASAHDLVPQLTGVTFVKHQSIGTIGDTPYLAHEYAGGRSLRHIVDRARGGQGITPNPVPLDQAIVIAEKTALSLATTAELRSGAGQRLAHGALIPQFIWISDDGEIRIGGQQLGPGVIASLKDPKVAQELGRYFAPEYRASGEPSKTADVFSMGAILYLLVTGVEPPDATTSSAFAQTVGASKTASGSALPDDIRAILTKSLDPDPNHRYASVGDMKTAISALASSGKYSATTFNLAFYLSNLLKKEMESEALDREKESKVNVAAYAEAPSQSPHRTAPIPEAAPFASMAAAANEKKSKAPIAIAAGVIAVLAIGGAAFFLSKKSPAPAVTATVTQANAAAPVAPPKPKFVAEPVVAQASPATATTATTGTLDAEAARKKAFEDAVKAKYQEELMKLQTDYTKKLQQSQSKNAPVQTAAATPREERPAPAEERPSVSAAQLDAQRREAAAPAATTPAPAPSPQVAQQQPQTPAPAPAQPQAPAVREGDVVDINDVDAVPRALTSIRPQYPPIAARQRVEGTVLLTALISETGQILDVKVLRGVGYGLDEAAVRAMRSARFSPAMKDGKRVKTWFPQQITFKL
jgi:periplasmic protein TonB